MSSFFRFEHFLEQYEYPAHVARFPPPLKALRLAWPPGLASSPPIEHLTQHQSGSGGGNQRRTLSPINGRRGSRLGGGGGEDSAAPADFLDRNPDIAKMISSPGDQGEGFSLSPSAVSGGRNSQRRIPAASSLLGRGGLLLQSKQRDIAELLESLEDVSGSPYGGASSGSSPRHDAPPVGGGDGAGGASQESPSVGASLLGRGFLGTHREIDEMVRDPSAFGGNSKRKLGPIGGGGHGGVLGGSGGMIPSSLGGGGGGEREAARLQALSTFGPPDPEGIHNYLLPGEI